MIVYGCAADKNVVSCDFSAKEILHYGIDPDHLDLFEANPVTVTKHGQTLQFSPMREFAFYLGANPYLGSKLPAKHVAMLDGSGRHCFLADSFFHSSTRDSGPRYVSPSVMSFGPAPDSIFHNLTPSSMSFEEAFAAYASWQEWFLICKQSGELPLDQPTPLLMGTRLQSKSVRIIGKNAIAQCRTGNDLLQGRMFKKFKIDANTSERIDWVFEALGQWDPVVTGRALVDSLLKRPVKNVVFLMRGWSLLPAIQSLEKLGIKVGFNETAGGELNGITFKRKGCRYTGTDATNDAIPLPFSVEQMKCVKSNEIEATWLALHDCDRRLMRHFSGNGFELQEQIQPLERVDRLNGFSFVKVEPLADPKELSPKDARAAQAQLAVSRTLDRLNRSAR